MPFERCALGTCKRYSRYTNRPGMQGVLFYPSPKPATYGQETINIINNVYSVVGPQTALDVENMRLHRLYLCLNMHISNQSVTQIYTSLFLFCITFLRSFIIEHSISLISKACYIKSLFLVYNFLMNVIERYFFLKLWKTVTCLVLSRHLLSF